ncbi:MAG: hypothetical protein IT223_00535 [Crocinitomicaceae bacterium]|nr:hypothetical protein [Crocinitomicaceae bacterium]
MNTLPLNWITEGAPDFEYKKYLLLAYLQKCRQQFDQTRLYPSLAELIEHFRNLNDLRESMNLVNNRLPKEISGIDMTTTSLQFISNELPEDAVQTVTEIIEFALPNLRHTIHEGKDIYELVERHIEILPVGLIPLHKSEGFLMLSQDQSAEVHIYSYRHSVIVGVEENYQSLQLNYVYTESKTIANTIEQIKLNLAKKYQELPNPATFFCVSHLNVPLVETLLPVSKRLLVKSLMAA